MGSRTEVEDLNLDALVPWLKDTLGENSNSVKAEKFEGGQSNPTYKITFGTSDYVLRRKPFGNLLPSAHAVDREYKILSALKPTGFAVPTPIALCQDPGVIGVDFYLMEYLDGRVFNHLHMPKSDPKERREIYTGLMQTLADLHRIDFHTAGLGDFERPGNYFERQVKRWSKQYRASQTDEVPAIEYLLEYLPDTTPEPIGTSIIHGDYSLKNVMFSRRSSEALAVLDWELTTIGDPIADLSYATMYWVMPPDDPFAMVHVDLDHVGIPRLEEMQDIYAQAAGLTAVPKLDWYHVFNLFRLVGIFQGIKKRMLDGNASSAKAAEIVKLIPGLAERAAEIAKTSTFSK